MPAPSINRRNVLLRQHAAPCLPFNAGHLYMGLYRCYKGIFKTGTEVLSIILHTSSSNTRSCLVRRLKGKTLLLPPHKKREDAHILCDARFKSQLTIRCCCSTTSISPPIRQRAAGLSAFLSLCLALYVCVRVTRTSRVCSYLAERRWLPCVEEVCKIWIWLFRNVRGERFEGSSVVLMARGKIFAFACRFAARKR